MKDRLTPDLLRALCHELRGPLGAMGNWVHVLESGKASEEARARAIDALGRDVRAMNELVGRLSNLASLMEGPTTELVIVDTAPFVEDLLAAAAHESGRPVPVSFAASTCQVLASPGRLRELLWPFVAAPPDSPDRALSLAVLAEEARVAFTIEARYPRSLSMALAGALLEMQGGDMVVTEGAAQTLLRFRLHVAP